MENNVLLGFIDEPIADSRFDKTDYTTNKFGGFPDWITPRKNTKVTCKLCGLVTPLLLQIYAPIKERIHYHRTLYIFACINPICWGKSKSWICLKNQLLVKETLVEHSSTLSSANDWCTDANDWGFNESEHNNISSFVENEVASVMNRVSISREENANVIPDNAHIEVAYSIPSAEIEPDENEPITVDTPTTPTCDLVNLLQQTPSSPKVYHEKINFLPSYIYVLEEKLEKDPLSEHVQMLLMEYSRISENRNDLKVSRNINVPQQSDEKYEKSHPTHGDKLFHTFMSRIKMNPEQVVRYCRSNQSPLFLYPEIDIPVKCNQCGGEMVFEIQVLSTILNYLRLANENRNYKDYIEFGSAFVYTCKQSCDLSEEEYIIVQAEKF